MDSMTPKPWDRHQIMSLGWIISDLWPFLGIGGHLGRHLENNSFLNIRFWSTFSMLFLRSNTTKNRWKPLLQLFFGVGCFLPYIDLTNILVRFHLYCPLIHVDTVFCCCCRSVLLFFFSLFFFLFILMFDVDIFLV